MYGLEHKGDHPSRSCAMTFIRDLYGGGVEVSNWGVFLRGLRDPLDPDISLRLVPARLASFSSEPLRQMFSFRNKLETPSAFSLRI